MRSLFRLPVSHIVMRNTRFVSHSLSVTRTHGLTNRLAYWIARTRTDTGLMRQVCAGGTQVAAVSADPLRLSPPAQNVCSCEKLIELSKQHKAKDNTFL